MPIYYQSNSNMPIQLKSNTNRPIQSLNLTNPMPNGSHHNPQTTRPHIYLLQCSKMDWHRSAVHWHASTKVKPILYQSEATCASRRGTSVLYGQASSLNSGRFSARDTARVWTNASSIEPLQSLSSQTRANLMPVHCQYDINPSTIRCRPSANPSQSGGKSPQPGRPQIIDNPVPVQNKSISNWLAIDSQFIPNLMSVHD